MFSSLHEYKKLELIEKVESSSLEIITEEVARADSLMKKGHFYFRGTDNYVYLHLRAPYSFPQETDWKHFNEVVLPHELYTTNTSYAEKFPELLAVLSSFAKKNNASLSRVFLAKIKDAAVPYLHVDLGFFYIFHKRYHFVISSHGSEMESGGVTKIFTSGDIFFINNKIPHTGMNHIAGDERIHVFFDVLPKNWFTLGYMYIQWLLVYRSIQGFYNYSLGKGLFGLVYLFQACMLSFFAYPNESKT